MLISVLPLVVLILGLLMYALATNAKVQEMGRIAFAFGLLVSLMVFSHLMRV
jgi:SpoU rRNA methylase family enzyme